MRRCERRTPTRAARASEPPTDKVPMIRYRTRSNHLRRAAILLALLALAGCSTLSSWIPTIPAPSFGWFSSSKKLGPLPEFKPVANPRIGWQFAVGKAAPGLEPAVTLGAIYPAATN